MAQDGSNTATHVHSVTLVRHGRTAYNAAGRLQGQTDIPLDAAGMWQVERAGESLRRLYVDGERGGRPHARQMVVSSDLIRAMQTAHAFADPLVVEVHPDPRVRERDFGEWEGRTLRELEERWPDDFAAWMAFQGGEMRHGAESKHDVGMRGTDAVNDWARRAGDDTDLFVFSHGAWISQTLQTLLGLDLVHPDFASLVSLRNAHWVRLIPMDLPDGVIRWRLAAFNQGPAAVEDGGWADPKLP